MDDVSDDRSNHSGVPSEPLHHGQDHRENDDRGRIIPFGNIPSGVEYTSSGTGADDGDGEDVYSGVGTMGPGSGAYLDRAYELEQRIARLRDRQAVPQFSTCTFLAAIKKATITPGGGMDIVLSVPPQEKYNAFPLTDAQGIMVLIKAERQRRRSRS